MYTRGQGRSWKVGFCNQKSKNKLYANCTKIKSGDGGGGAGSKCREFFCRNPPKTKKNQMKSIYKRIPKQILNECPPTVDWTTIPDFSQAWIQSPGSKALTSKYWCDKSSDGKHCDYWFQLTTRKFQILLQLTFGPGYDAHVVAEEKAANCSNAWCHIHDEVGLQDAIGWFWIAAVWLTLKSKYSFTMW